jgi:hypothetical protein
MTREHARDRIAVNIVLMVYEVPSIANPVICESPLPDFSAAAEDSAKGMRISAPNKLHRMFERNARGRGQQEVNMFRHHDKGVELQAAFAAVAIDGLQEETNIGLYHEEPSTLPRRKRHKIGSGRGDESSRLQGQTSAAKAAIFA